MMHNIFGPSLNDELPGRHDIATSRSWPQRHSVHRWHQLDNSSTLNATGKPGVPNGSTAGKKQLKTKRATHSS